MNGRSKETVLEKFNPTMTEFVFRVSKREVFMLGSSADMSAMLDFAFSPAGAHTAQLQASPYFPEILLYNSNAIIYLFKNISIKSIQARSEKVILELSARSSN